MSEELDTRIKRLEDIEEIKNLQARYAYLIDTRQFERVADLFTDDLVADYGGMAKHTSKAELVEGMTRDAAGYSMWRHQMLMPLIELDGDKATGTWYLLCPFTAIRPEGDVPGWIQGKYERIDYVRVDGIWKIRHLTFTLNFFSPYDDGWVKTPMMGL